MLAVGTGIELTFSDFVNELNISYLSFYTPPKTIKNDYICFTQCFTQLNLCLFHSLLEFEMTAQTSRVRFQFFCGI